jgi:hypothetical protein
MAAERSGASVAAPHRDVRADGDPSRRPMGAWGGDAAGCRVNRRSSPGLDEGA